MWEFRVLLVFCSSFFPKTSRMLWVLVQVQRSRRVRAGGRGGRATEDERSRRVRAGYGREACGAAGLRRVPVWAGWPGTEDESFGGRGYGGYGRVHGGYGHGTRRPSP